MEGKMFLSLKNWTEFNAALPSFSERQVQELLEFELKNVPRKSIVLRLHQRVNALRVAREREELLTNLK